MKRARSKIQEDDRVTKKERQRGDKRGYSTTVENYENMLDSANFKIDSDTDNGSLFSMNFNSQKGGHSRGAKASNLSVRSIDSGNVTVQIRKFDRIEADAAMPHHVEKMVDESGNIIKEKLKPDKMNRV